MDETTALLKRIYIAIEATTVRRSEVFLELPQCHKAKCQGHHPDGASALSLMERQIRESIRHELLYRSTTRPDVADDNDPDRAVLTLATLLSKYNVHDAGTYIRAAELLLEAYPEIREALSAKEARRG